MRSRESTPDGKKSFVEILKRIHQGGPAQMLRCIAPQEDATHLVASMSNPSHQMHCPPPHPERQHMLLECKKTRSMILKRRCRRPA